jgi:hypothetical protein
MSGEGSGNFSQSIRSIGPDEGIIQHDKPVARSRNFPITMVLLGGYSKESA